MSRRASQRWLIGGAAVLLAGLAIWQWKVDQRRDPGLLLSIAPADVERIDLAIPGTPDEHYARRDGHWQAVDGTTVAVDAGRLDELTQTAAAAVLSWRPASDFDPARIGLAPPVASLSLNGQRLDFGETSVTGPQRYVRVGERVALISVRFTPRPSQGVQAASP
ncbi:MULTISPECIES: hypothetical protein [Dyella]|uniref:DUF4340 domain-containing protein n=2 Tax=Dyella TaxID=231454 RepID=A0A4R0YLI7_9GAMM|nr:MULTISPECIES: hypothetical protein [Dyella]TBR36600.1 hypothetical protein EYV96_11755 [Dyella terrae]TCI08308.1 hypothetical protein EZM97_27115 [Dyella soli]